MSLQIKEPKDLEGEAVDAFLWAQRNFTDMLKGRGHIYGARHWTPGHKAEKESSDFDREVWALLHNSRLYVVPPVVYAKLYRAADIYTTEKFTDEAWVVTTKTALERVIENALDRNEELEKGRQLFSAIIEGATEVPAPASLPFDSVFVCYAGGVTFDWSSVCIRGFGESFPVDTAQLIGHLMAYSGDDFRAYEILRAGDRMISNPIHYSHRWLNPVDLNPWIINSIADLVFRQKLIVEKPLTTDQRFKYRKLKRGKLMAPIPRPYYVVHVRDEVLQTTIDDVNRDLHRRTFQYSYRFDVSGHERCKVRRGTLPLEPKDADKLAQRGYQVYTLDDLPAEHLERLAARGQHPKKPGEWLAIKVTLVDSYQKGPEKAPYIPATRVVKS